MKTFQLNGKAYRTDEETLSVLRSIVPSARESGDSSAVQAVMALGLRNGRITETGIEMAYSKQLGRFVSTPAA